MTKSEAVYAMRFMRRFCLPDALHRITIDHGVDATGHCRSCHADGATTGRVVGPCNLLVLATAALGR